MAELVGLIASAATLSKIAKFAVEISHLLQNAPDETRQVSAELVQLSVHSSLVGELRARWQNTDCLDNPAAHAVNQSLVQIEEKLRKIADDLQRLMPKQSKRSTLKWAMLRRSDTTRLLSDLASTRAALSITLALAACLDMPSPPRSIARESQNPHTCEPSCNVKELTSWDVDIEKQDVEETMEDDYLRDHPTYSWLWKLSPPCLAQCASGLVWQSHKRRFTTSGMSILIKMPFSYAATLKLIVRTYETSRIAFSIMRGSSFAFCNLVPIDCEFFLACSRGDVERMRYMLEKRLACPTDITENGRTPMCMAIMGGSTQAVKLLLDSGVDVDSCFGGNQISPLAWAIKRRNLGIVRLLLSYNASCHHLTGYGWSPLFYLWPGIDEPAPAGDIIETLRARSDFSFSHQNVVDIEGYGVLHRAALFAEAPDVITLIRAGVNRYTTEGRLKWTAIYHAVHYNRLDTFEALLPYFQHHQINDSDTRGWTLLHISASEGHDKITRRLLELGANWQALSMPSFSGLPEELYGGCWTPAEVALAQGGVEDGQRRKDLYLRAVRDVLGVSTSLAEGGNVDDNWTDAPELIISQ